MLRCIKVRNFRTLVNFALDIPTSYFCIVGDNNVGKSNIVTALKWLFVPESFPPGMWDRGMPSVDLPRTASSLTITIEAALTAVIASVPALADGRTLVDPNGLMRVSRRFRLPAPTALPAGRNVQQDYAAAERLHVLVHLPDGNGIWQEMPGIEQHFPRVVHIRPSDIGIPPDTTAPEDKLAHLIWPGELTDEDHKWVDDQLQTLLGSSVVRLSVDPDTGIIMYWDEYGYFVPLRKAGSGTRQIAYTLLRIALARRQAAGQGAALSIFLDEPEQHLSSGRQRAYADLLANLAQEQQIIVTSHSSNFLRRDLKGANCVLIRGSASHGTEARPQGPSDTEAVRATLGISAEDSLYFGEVNVLVEGATEATALPLLLSSLHAAGRTTLRAEQLTIIQRDGASKVLPFAKILAQIGLGIVLLLDSDNATRDVETAIRNDPVLAQAHVLKIPLAGSLREAEFEDLFPRSLVIAAANRYVARRGWSISEADFQALYARAPFWSGKKWSECLKEVLRSKTYITGLERLDDVISKPAIIADVVTPLNVDQIPSFLTREFIPLVQSTIKTRPTPTVPGQSLGIPAPSRATTWLHEANFVTTTDHDL